MKNYNTIVNRKLHALGLCVGCRKEVANRWRCPDCTKRLSQIVKSYRLRNNTKGLCGCCKRPLSVNSTKRCDHHIELDKIRWKANRLKKKEKEKENVQSNA